MKALISLALLLSSTFFLHSDQTAPSQGDDEGRILALETAWNHAEQN